MQPHWTRSHSFAGEARFMKRSVSLPVGEGRPSIQGATRLPPLRGGLNVGWHHALV